MIIKLINSILHYLVITPAKGDIVARYKTRIKSKGGDKSMGLYAQIDANLKPYGKTRKDLSFPTIPNISKFKIHLNIYNPLLLAYGIIGKYKPEIDIHPYSLRHAQRYLIYMQKYLSVQLDNPAFYWKVAQLLIKRSKVYLISCLFSIDKNWYRKLDNKELRYIIKKVDILRGRKNGLLSHELQMTRVYVPKVWGSDLWRGLGVPNKV
jgi:hypothetical protein